MSISIIIADDHTVIREGIRTVIERKTSDMHFIGEAANGKEVLALAVKKPADVYVLDISMPLLNGIETTYRLMHANSKNRVIILSMHNDHTCVEKALRAGARGYLLKEDATDEIILAIREVMQGRCFLSPNISAFVIQGFLLHRNGTGMHKNEGTLTSREKEILQLITEGFSTKKIAVQLHLSLNTVHTHRKNIMSKLGVHGQAELIRYALKEIAL